MSWLAVVSDEDDFHGLRTQQRRRLSVRRHGWKGDHDKKFKTNFSEEYLEPAAQGELKEKHSSGIPKLAVRKSKGHNIQGDWNYGEVDNTLEDSGMVLDDPFELNDESALNSLSDESGLVETLSKDISRAKAKKFLESHSHDDRLPTLSAL